MFGSLLPPVVCRRNRVLITLYVFYLDYPILIASSVISNVYVCNNEGKNYFLYDKLNKSYKYKTEISLTQIQMHICEWAVGLFLLKKWNFFCLSVLLVFVLYCDRKPPTLRTTSDLMMNVQTCITDDTTKPCCMSDHYVWFNDECKNMFYW
jgi:hypothetical protein